MSCLLNFSLGRNFPEHDNLLHALPIKFPLAVVRPPMYSDMCIAYEKFLAKLYHTQREGILLDALNEIELNIPGGRTSPEVGIPG